ncbi:hypothetical protein K1T71_004715 [Dendrolimus kikuchii]|uniref:Uncharacterized protein n=1 Tax=Dendrolimus kikuchii TaxID=765133 RepID=A0ACC1D833_9NEOP|nr:hypothetical protein K1T71_004715 [Dendrolimus kikuchii]
MSNRDGQNWMPIAAGLLISAGIVTLVYKSFGTGCRGTLKNSPNQQSNVPFKCTCKKGGNSRCQLHNVK